MKDLEKIKKELSNILDPARYQHSLRVEETALGLAKQYGEDPAKTSLAALLHDVSRCLDGTAGDPKKWYLGEAERAGLAISEAERAQPELLHAVLSAEIASQKFKIQDEEVLNAIRSHTQGNENMSLLEKIIYLADHIEPGRSHPEAEKIRELASKDLNQAIAASANAMLRYLAETNQLVSDQTIKTRDAYLKI